MTQESVDLPFIQPDPDRKIGPHEASALMVVNGLWDSVVIEQRGPDGTEVIGVLGFFACPMCGSVVPPQTVRQGPEATGLVDYPRRHAQYHLSQARDLDGLASTEES